MPQANVTFWPDGSLLTTRTAGGIGGPTAAGDEIARFQLTQRGIWHIKWRCTCDQGPVFALPVVFLSCATVRIAPAVSEVVSFGQAGPSYDWQDETLIEAVSAGMSGATPNDYFRLNFAVAPGTGMAAGQSLFYSFWGTFLGPR